MLIKSGRKKLLELAKKEIKSSIRNKKIIYTIILYLSCWIFAIGIAIYLNYDKNLVEFCSKIYYIVFIIQYLSWFLIIPILVYLKFYNFFDQNLLDLLKFTNFKVSSLLLGKIVALLCYILLFYLLTIPLILSLVLIELITLKFYFWYSLFSILTALQFCSICMLLTVFLKGQKTALIGNYFLVSCYFSGIYLSYKFKVVFINCFEIISPILCTKESYLRNVISMLQIEDFKLFSLKYLIGSIIVFFLTLIVFKKGLKNN